MSKQTRAILWLITIVLFLLGIWPIALVILIILIIESNKEKRASTEKLTNEIEELKKKVENLEKNP